MNGNSIRKEIVEKADIVNIVSQYVKLEKRGNNYIGLCPFHDDKNPSMSVSPQKKVFKCFSCGTAGDVVSFVSKIKNITTSEALREVGETVGIKVSMSQKDILKQKNSKYYNVLKEASTFFNFFLTNTVDGKKGIEYLSSRKLTDFEIRRFNIGLAGDNDVLYKTLSEKQYLPLDMIEVGLIRGGTHYHDTFKNRIMFPIKDLEGNVVGFSGRRFLPISDNESKYINTSETILFKKSEILYNYSDCINDIKINNNVYLFEGFMDVIAAVRANVKNSVASMGTALTINQINAIKRLTNNVTLCFDSDGPGVAATIKAIQLLTNANVNVNVVTIPDGKDPDEYIFNNGSEKLHYCLVNNIVSSMEFLYNYEKRNTDFNNYNSIDNFKNIIFKHLSMYKSNIFKEKILNLLSKDLNINIENLSLDYNNNYNSNYNNSHDNNYTDYAGMEPPINNFVDEIPVSDIVPINDNPINKRYEYLLIKYRASERKLLYACYHNKKDCFEIENALESHYFDEINRNILFKILTFYRTHDLMNKEVMFSTLSFEEANVLQSVLDSETLPNQKEIITLVNNIKNWPYDKVINILNNKDEKTPEDLKRITEYKRKITIIKKNKE